MRTMTQQLQGVAGEQLLLASTDSALAFRVEESLAGSRTELDAMSVALVDLLSNLCRKLPRPVFEAVTGATNADSALQQAFVMGQLSFAQLLVSQAALSRVGDDFVPMMRHRAYQKYLKALRGQERSGNELSAVTGERPETVSRKLKHLRQLGVTDFRKEGNVVLNFLTSAARAAMAAETSAAG